MRTAVTVICAIALFAGVSCTGESENSSGTKRVITLENTPAKRPYSPAIEAGNMLFVSGQVAVDQASGKLIEGGIEAQTRQVLGNLKSIVEKAGYTMNDIVRCTVLLSDISFYNPMNQVYMEFFPADPPARMAFAVKDLPMGALVEIDAIAVKQ